MFLLGALFGVALLFVVGCSGKAYLEPPIISHAKTLADRQHWPPPIEPTHIEFQKGGKCSISYLEPDCRTLVMLFSGFQPKESIRLTYSIRAREVHLIEQEAFQDSLFLTADEHGSQFHSVYFTMPQEKGGYFVVAFSAHGEKVLLKLPWGDEVWKVCTVPKTPEEKNPRASHVS